MSDGVRVSELRDQPKVSIIIPVRNGVEHLAATLESAIGQTWANKEIVVVDDGSTDDSDAVAERYATDYLRLVRQKHAGAAAARNRGLSIASGDYIQYLDADDLMSPDKIEQQVRLLQSLPPGCVASCPWGRFQRSPGDAAFAREVVWGDFGPLDWLVCAWEGGGMMQTACWLTPRSVAESAGPWDEELSLHDDGECFCRVLLASKGVRYCPGAKVYYRAQRPGSLSCSGSRRAVESAFRVCESYRERALACEGSQRVRHALAMNYAKFVYEYHPNHADLLTRAWDQLRSLGFESPPPVGGRRFRWLAQRIGMANALAFRAWFDRGH